MSYNAMYQSKNGIRTDYSLSRSGLEEPYGIRDSELAEVVNFQRVIDIRKELKDVREHREDSDRYFKTELGVLNSPWDDKLRERVSEIAGRMEKKGIEYVVHAGIGGSELGATAVIHALNQGRTRKYLPVTNLGEANNRLLDEIVPERTVLVGASRSGKTPETNLVFSRFLEKLKERLGDSYKEQVVVITGDSGPFKDLAQKEGLEEIYIESEMSGRYSAFHSSNLLTMALMGVNIDLFHAGGRYMFDKCMQADPIKDEALVGAALGYLFNTRDLKGREKGGEKVVFNTGVLSPQLLKYGEWLDQLTEESLGRPGINISAKTTELPNKAHSDFQNWIAGGNNIFYHQFVVPLSEDEDLVRAAYYSISKALADEGCPSFTTFLLSVNEAGLSQLLMRDMLRVIYMGELYGLGNLADLDSAGHPRKGYFQQPDVEKYKKIMKPLLEKPEDLRRRWKEDIDKFGERFV